MPDCPVCGKETYWCADLRGVPIRTDYLYEELKGRCRVVVRSKSSGVYSLTVFPKNGRRYVCKRVSAVEYERRRRLCDDVK
jgi:hypothetical protein